MRWRMNVIAIAMSIAFPFVVAHERRLPQILFVREYHGDEISANTGEEWLALVKSDNGISELKKVKLKVEMVRDEIVEDEKGQKTGKKVSLIDFKGNVLFLIKGIPGAKVGPVETIISKEVLSPNKRVTLALASGGHYDMVLDCLPPSTDQQEEQGTCKLMINQGTISQTLGE